MSHHEQPVIAGPHGRVAPYPQSRRVYQAPVGATSPAGVFTQLAAVSAAEFGHGWIELESQDCVVEWKVSRRTDQIIRNDFYLTGPAGGREALEIEEYVQVGFNVWFITGSAISPENGAILAGGPVPMVTARWLSDEPSRRVDAILTVAIGNGAAFVPVGWVPGYARGVVVSTQLPAAQTAVQPPKFRPSYIPANGAGLTVWSVESKVFDIAAVPLPSNGEVQALPSTGVNTSVVCTWQRHTTLQIPRTPQ